MEISRHVLCAVTICQKYLRLHLRYFAGLDFTKPIIDKEGATNDLYIYLRPRQMRHND
jgi:hypothetical protein